MGGGTFVRARGGWHVSRRARGPTRRCWRLRLESCRSLGRGVGGGERCRGLRSSRGRGVGTRRGLVEMGSCWLLWWLSGKEEGLVVLCRLKRRS